MTTEQKILYAITGLSLGALITGTVLLLHLPVVVQIGTVVQQLPPAEMREKLKEWD